MRHARRAEHGVDRRPARREVERPQHADHHLEADERPVAPGAAAEEQRQRERRRHPARLREEEHPARRDLVGDDAGERAHHHHGRGAREGGEAHHERRAGELEREPAERDEVHPPREVDEAPRRPEPAVARVPEDVDTRTTRTGRAVRRGLGHAVIAGAGAALPGSETGHRGSGGRRSRQPAACSYAQPIRSAMASSPGWQRIWSDVGRPSAVKPFGTARPQSPR